jgi:hypothetical protein
VTVGIALRDKKYPVEFLINCGGTRVLWQRIAADTAAATAAAAIDDCGPARSVLTDASKL